MKHSIRSQVGKYAALLLIALIGTAAILIIIKAGVIASTNLNEVNKAEDVDYQLRKLKEQEMKR